MTDRTAYRQRVATVRGRARAQLAAIRQERLARMKAGVGTDDPLAAAWAEDRLADEAASGEEHALQVPLRLVEDPGAGAGEWDNPDGDGPDREVVAPGDPDPGVPPADEAAPIATEEPVPGPLGAPAGLAGRSADPAGDGATDRAEPVDALLTVEPETPSQEAGGSGFLIPSDAHAASVDEAEPWEAVADASAEVPAEVQPPEDPPEEPSPVDMGEPSPAQEPAAPAATDLSEIPGVGPGLVWMLRSAGIATLDDLARADADDLARRLGTIARLLDLGYFIDFARTRTSAR